jgi:hypothetical protein
MAFSHANHTDARGSIFSNPGRDHIVYQTIVHLTPPGNSDLDQTVPRLLYNLGDVSQRSNFSAGIPYQRNVITRTYPPGAGSADDDAATLIVKIVQLLIDHGEGHPDLKGVYRGLKLDLELLHKTLTLTSLAVQTFEYTPFGQNLANSIIPEVVQCCEVLQGLFEKIDGYRRGLNHTSIHSMWFQVFWSGCETDELSSLRKKLSVHQRSLSEFLMALNS